MISRAWRRFEFDRRERCSLRHSSRSRPLKLSTIGAAHLRMVLHRLARRDVVPLDAAFPLPPQDRVRRQFRAPLLWRYELCSSRVRSIKGLAVVDGMTPFSPTNPTHLIAMQTRYCDVASKGEHAPRSACHASSSIPSLPSGARDRNKVGPARSDCRRTMHLSAIERTNYEASTVNATTLNHEQNIRKAASPACLRSLNLVRSRLRRNNRRCRTGGAPVLESPGEAGPVHS